MVAGGAVLLSSCNRQPSYKQLNPVQSRGFPIWMPALPNCTFRPVNLSFAQSEPFEVDNIIIHYSTEVQCGQMTGSFSQLQIIVSDFGSAKRQHAKFWEGVDSVSLEPLLKRRSGYVLSASQERAWVKLGNIWLHLRGDGWVVQKLATHYVQTYDKMVTDIDKTVRRLSVPNEARSNFEVLYEYKEYRTPTKP